MKNFVGGQGSEYGNWHNVGVLRSTFTLLALAFTLTGAMSTALPMRLLLVGGTRGRGLVLLLASC